MVWQEALRSLMHNRHIFAVFYFVLLSWQGTVAQIMSEEKIGDKTIMCMRSGLTSTHKDCSVRAGWYTYVFVGSISAVTPSDNDEMEVRIVPEEVFLGAPPIPLTVTTSQGLCLQKLAAGARWLFYLRQQKDEPIVIDYYGNDSRPVADAQEQIETFRRLRSIGDLAIVRGQIVRRSSSEGDAVPQAKVVAQRRSDGLQFSSTTNAEGRFEMPPLPPGKYEIVVGRIGSYQPDDDGIEVSRGDCWDLTISRSLHVRIGGHARRSDGSAVADVEVVLIRSDDSWYATTQTDENGEFEFDSMEPGQFLIGLNFPARPDWFNGAGAGPGVKIPPASLFYPGVASRSAAVVIRLATDEQIDNIDFLLTAQ